MELVMTKEDKENIIKEVLAKIDYSFIMDLKKEMTKKFETDEMQLRIHEEVKAYYKRRKIK